MDVFIINNALAFLEGFALIISPCILPILPIILSGSLSGGERHPIGIIVGFVATFAVFTLFARQLVVLLGVDLNILRDISFILLLFFGFILLSSYLTERFNHVFERLANLGANVAVLNNPQGGFWSGFLFG
ncbi:MAG TPA: cytochrome c biogenesis protein DipZ, partial [Gammaproteobacteria bacterium]|nr:cytochrome c biogenesis protein DipZ [Gammaproteobacteria bacterium]